MSELIQPQHREKVKEPSAVVPSGMSYRVLPLGNVISVIRELPLVLQSAGLSTLQRA